MAQGAPHKQADPFDYGGGHVDPNKAIAPGLIYDIESSDYIVSCAPWVITTHPSV